MADASQLQLNPYALFDPSQWSNPYSNFQNQALPAASYAGWPTNAMGQPIQPQPGMTINQTPAQPAAAPATSQSALNQAMMNAISANARAAGSPSVPTQGAMGQVSYSPNPAAIGAQNYAAQLQRMMQSPSQAAQPAAAVGGVANAAGLTPQQYMALRANPGPVPTYGATVPQSASSAQPGSGVLQQFLANWKPASSGPGAGFQQGFASALKGMGYS